MLGAVDERLIPRSAGEQHLCADQGPSARVVPSVAVVPPAALVIVIADPPARPLCVQSVSLLETVLGLSLDKSCVLLGGDTLPS